jgi:hypothetical protein
MNIIVKHTQGITEIVGAGDDDRFVEQPPVLGVHLFENRKRHQKKNTKSARPTVEFLASLGFHTPADTLRMIR